MSIRAVIFDVYNTLLAVGAGPPDADRQWEELGRSLLGRPPSQSLGEFTRMTESIIAREHETARRAGILQPEIYWPAVACEALPELRALPEKERDGFLDRHVQLLRAVSLPSGAAQLLPALRSKGIRLGIASNSQPYTVRELETAFWNGGLTLTLFDPKLCFWSFEAGFSKPNPHVFRILTARLNAMGILPAEILMVGDRVDNDLLPAQAQGWKAWHLCENSAPATGLGGGWDALKSFLNL